LIGPSPEFVMIVFVGLVVVFGSVLGGFTMAGGHVGALIHPSELITIGGAALGALIIMSPKKVLIDLMHGMIQTIKGSPYGKKAYDELFRVMYELARLSRVNGILALEPHVTDPHSSTIFQKYPGIAKNHHATGLICGLLSPVIDGAITPDKVPELAAAELKAIENEHHGPLFVLTKTADGLPGFGIVAAVLGIVVTMANIDGPVEEIGHSMGAALVGTFLGILMSYGVFAPLAAKLEFLGHEEMAFFHTVAAVVEGIVGNQAPKVCIEMACRGLSSDVRLDGEELKELFSAVEKAG